MTMRGFGQPEDPQLGTSREMPRKSLLRSPHASLADNPDALLPERYPTGRNRILVRLRLSFSHTEGFSAMAGFNGVGIRDAKG